MLMLANPLSALLELFLGRAIGIVSGLLALPERLSVEQWSEQGWGNALVVNRCNRVVMPIHAYTLSSIHDVCRTARGNWSHLDAAWLAFRTQEAYCKLIPSKYSIFMWNSVDSNNYF